MVSGKQPVHQQKTIRMGIFTVYFVWHMQLHYSTILAYTRLSVQLYQIRARVTCLGCMHIIYYTGAVYLKQAAGYFDKSYIRALRDHTQPP